MTAGCAASRRVLARTPVAPLPASSPKRPTDINGRTSAPPEMYLPDVTTSCSFQLPKVCSFRLPLTITRYFESEVEQRSGKYILLHYPQPSGLIFLNTTMEQFPSQHNTVSPGPTRTRFGTRSPIINFNYTEQLRKREREVLEYLETIARQIGLKISHRRTYVNAHPMCTTRMSKDPRDGVIDPKMRIHTLDNVYACGSASFTTAGAINPTLTIAALRAAEHIDWATTWHIINSDNCPARYDVLTERDRVSFVVWIAFGAESFVVHLS